MAGPSNQSATVTPRRGGDTPLASIRPMSVQNSRTAAVLPTSQTTNVVSIHGSSSNSSSSTVTALVPPQQVHSASGGMAGEVMSTTSSHTDYMPATSSAASIVVAAVSPMGMHACCALKSNTSNNHNYTNISSFHFISFQVLILINQIQHNRLHRIHRKTCKRPKVLRIHHHRLRVHK